MKNIPAIILCGGLGTRLRSVVQDMPKPMANVNGKPFLHYILRYLEQQNIREVILAVGYKREIIQDYFGVKYGSISVKYAIEEEPLGTGGGIKNAFDLVDDFAFVVNGDTFFEIDFNLLKEDFAMQESDLVMALKPMKNFDRYGTVTLQDKRVVGFGEKQQTQSGLINGGVYLFHKSIFKQNGIALLNYKFSFEKDVLEQYYDKLKFTGCIFDDYFIDIGIPSDYQRAQIDFQELFYD